MGVFVCKWENVCNGSISLPLLFFLCVCVWCWWLLSIEAAQQWVTVMERFHWRGEDADECGQQNSEDDDSVTEGRKRRRKKPQRNRWRRCTTGQQEKKQLAANQLILIFIWSIKHNVTTKFSSWKWTHNKSQTHKIPFFDFFPPSSF